MLLENLADDLLISDFVELVFHGGLKAVEFRQAAPEEVDDREFQRIHGFVDEVETEFD